LRDRLCLIQISSGDGNAHLIKFDNQLIKDNLKSSNIAKLLKNREIEKIFHFARFDMAALSYYIGPINGSIWCTKIASKLSRTYTDRHGLADLCRELLSIQINKEQQSSNWGKKSLSPEQKQYAANDVLYLHKIKKELTALLLQEGRLKLAETIFKFLETRVDLDLKGFGELDIFSH
jgi:ribonuclease D